MISGRLHASTTPAGANCVTAHLEAGDAILVGLVNGGRNLATAQALRIAAAASSCLSVDSYTSDLTNSASDSKFDRSCARTVNLGIGRVAWVDLLALWLENPSAARRRDRTLFMACVAR